MDKILLILDLHEDFNRSWPLPLNVAPISLEQFQKKLSDNQYKMVKVIADWERSGSGHGMINNLVDNGDDTEGNSTEARVYEFINGDNRKSFLHERPPHVLYLWYIAYTYDILHTVHQQLQNDCISEGLHAPSVASIKRKKSPEFNDPSVTTTNLSDNIQQIADSINGLVGVVKQSQTNQQVDFLHRRRKELEDTIGVLDSACVELELKILDETGKQRLVYKKALSKNMQKILDETGKRRLVYKKALSKNMQELDIKKEELDDNKRKLEKLIEETIPQKQKMPRFVNMAHLGIVHEEVDIGSETSEK